MRSIALLVTVLLVGGCAGGVEAVRNPQTGQVDTCGLGLADWSPWSQRDACLADHVAQGWTAQMKGER